MSLRRVFADSSQRIAHGRLLLSQQGAAPPHLGRTSEQGRASTLSAPGGLLDAGVKPAPRRWQQRPRPAAGEQPAAAGLAGQAQACEPRPGRGRSARPPPPPARGAGPEEGGRPDSAGPSHAAPCSEAPACGRHWRGRVRSEPHPGPEGGLSSKGLREWRGGAWHLVKPGL